MSALNPEKALIFRITHIANVPWLLEALVHHHLPITGLLGIACHDPTAQERLQTEIEKRNLSLKVIARPQWYF